MTEPPEGFFGEAPAQRGLNTHIAPRNAWACPGTPTSFEFLGHRQALRVLSYYNFDSCSQKQKHETKVT